MNKELTFQKMVEFANRWTDLQTQQMKHIVHVGLEIGLEQLKREQTTELSFAVVRAIQSKNGCGLKGADRVDDATKTRQQDKQGALSAIKTNIANINRVQSKRIAEAIELCTLLQGRPAHNLFCPLCVRRNRLYQ
jgi:hypothetical protein